VYEMKHVKCSFLFACVTVIPGRKGEQSRLDWVKGIVIYSFSLIGHNFSRRPRTPQSEDILFGNWRRTILDAVIHVCTSFLNGLSIYGIIILSQEDADAQSINFFKFQESTWEKTCTLCTTDGILFFNAI